MGCATWSNILSCVLFSICPLAAFSNSVFSSVDCSAPDRSLRLIVCAVFHIWFSSWFYCAWDDTIHLPKEYLFTFVNLMRTNVHYVLSHIYKEVCKFIMHFSFILFYPYLLTLPIPAPYLLMHNSPWVNEHEQLMGEKKDFESLNSESEYLCYAVQWYFSCTQN